MTKSGRELLRSAAAVTALAAAPRVSRADTFPTRPIRLVLPFPPGGVFDIVGRPWADKVSRTLGTVIVENMPGAGGSVAMTAVAHAAPDGYTVFLGSTAIHMADTILRTHHAALVPVTGWTPQKFDGFMQEEVARWTPLVKSIGVHID